jgi:hypothetical protein
MSVMFPLDDDGRPIPVLGFDYRGTQKIAVGATSTRHPVSIPSDIEIVSLIATGLCRFEVGGADVTADPAQSPVLFPGQYVDIPLRRGERWIAFIAEGEPCDAYVIGRV